MTKLYIFRHGETHWNVEGRFQGNTPHVPLNETGIQQAETLAKKLKNEGITIIYSSPLERAAQTASIIAQELNAPVIYKDDLQERFYGLIEGKTRAEVFEEDPELKAQMKQSKNCAFVTHKCDYGVETATQARHRITEAIRQAAKESPHTTIAISSHGAVIRMFLEYVQNQDEGDTPKNAEPIIVTYNSQSDTFTFVG